MENPQVAPRGPMSDKEYRECQEALFSLARTVAMMPDLDLFLERIGTAHALGPILDPTLYRSASGDLARIQELAACARVLQRYVRRLAGLSG